MRLKRTMGFFLNIWENKKLKDMQTTPPQPYSVREFVELLNLRLSDLSSEIVGEISEYKLATSGHAYFTLKDKEGGYILPCTIWRRDYELCGITLEIGMEVLVKGKPNFYGPFGKLSFIGRSVELVGEGALKKAYELLKKKLEKEGLFAADQKRPIPQFPEKIGVITSVRGAVIHDFSNNLRKSGFKVKILDSRVEGPESGRDLTLSVRAMQKERIDVLVIIRGGGSMQSLAGFDNEALVREIARFPVPVVTGVGHHQDVPLAALVADAAESTPSLCAALLSRPWIDAEYSMRQSERNIFNAIRLKIIETSELLLVAYRETVKVYASCINSARDNLRTTYGVAEEALHGILKKYTEAEQTVFHALVRVSAELSRSLDRVNHGQTSIVRAYDQALQMFFQQLESALRIISNSSPERQLRLGYSLAMIRGKLVRSVKDVREGEILTVKIADGELVSIIDKIM